APFRWVRMRRLVAFSLTCRAIVGLLDIALNCSALAQAPLPSSITEMIPAPGSTFPANGDVTFSWNAVQGATEYGIAAGKTQGGREYFSNSLGADRSFVTAVPPPDGSFIYITVGYKVAGIWTYEYFTYKAAGVITGMTPTPGSIFPADIPVVFSWNVVPGATEYSIAIGSTQGGKEYSYNDLGTESSFNAGVPLKDGRPIYITVGYSVSGVWKYHYFLYGTPGDIRHVRTLTGHTDGLTSVSFSPDGD